MMLLPLMVRRPLPELSIWPPPALTEKPRVKLRLLPV